MKICMEIKDGKFIYDYSFVGGERGHGDMPFGATHLEWFADVLKGCRQQEAWKNREKIDEINALGYIKMNPQILEDFIDNEEKKDIE